MPSIKVHMVGYNTSLQEVCDGLSAKQVDARQKQIDNALWMARERVLSAKSGRQSTINVDNISVRSSYSRTSERNDDYESELYDMQDSTAAKSYSQGTSPNPYSEANMSVSKYSISSRSGVMKSHQSQIPENRTLPGLPEQRSTGALVNHGTDDFVMRSYNSINNVYIPRRNMCSRAKSANAATGHVRYNQTLAWQCCDVLGPKVCRECGLLKRRIYDAYRQELPLSKLEVSEKNFSDSLVLCKNLPYMSIDEIEDKVMTGDILRASLKERIQLKKQRRNSEVRERSRTAPPFRKSKNEFQSTKKQDSVTWYKVTSTFFMNLQDLNNKVLIGKLNNKLSNFHVKGNDYWKGDGGPSTNVKTKTMAVVPVVKKEETQTTEKEKIDRSYSLYEPPLVPKMYQSTEPAFFAGSEQGYKLPDRLPDKVVEGQIDDFSELKPAWSRSGSSSATSQTESEM